MVPDTRDWFLETAQLNLCRLNAPRLTAETTTATETRTARITLEPVVTQRGPDTENDQIGTDRQLPREPTWHEQNAAHRKHQKADPIEGTCRTTDSRAKFTAINKSEYGLPVYLAQTSLLCSFKFPHITPELSCRA